MLLKNRYKAILLIDFDQTIAKTEYPKIIALRKKAKKYINLLYKENFYIIINTCRTGQYQDQVKDYLNKKQINFHQINENHPELVDFYNEDSRKLSGCISIDDKNLECLLNPKLLKWKHIYKSVHKVINKKSFKSSFHYIN